MQKNECSGDSSLPILLMSSCFTRQNLRASKCFVYLTTEGSVLTFLLFNKIALLFSYKPGISIFTLYSFTQNNTLLSFSGTPVIVLPKCSATVWCDCLLRSLIMMEVCFQLYHSITSQSNLISLGRSSAIPCPSFAIVLSHWVQPVDVQFAEGL